MAASLSLLAEPRRRFFAAHEAAILRPRSKAAKELPTVSVRYVAELETLLLQSLAEVDGYRARNTLYGGS